MLIFELLKTNAKYDFINKELFEKFFDDDYNFPVTTLIKIAEILNMEVGDLFVEESINNFKFD